MLIDDEYRDSVEILGDLLEVPAPSPAPAKSVAQRMDDAGSVDILTQLYDDAAADDAVAHELTHEVTPPPSTSIDLLSEAAFPTAPVPRYHHEHAIEPAPSFSDEDAHALASSMMQHLANRPHRIEIDVETDSSSGIDPDSVLEAVLRAAGPQQNQSDELPDDITLEYAAAAMTPRSHAPRQMSTEILGAVLQQSAAFSQYVDDRVNNNSPVLQKVPYKNDWRDWQIDFGPASAPAGEVLTFYNAPQCLFRGEKVIATDTGSPVGYGTRIASITVGQQVQRPARGASLTAFFANNALGNGIKWDTTDRAIQISVTVSFIQACTFDMSVFGRAVT